MRMACRPVTLNSPMPLERAVITYFSSSAWTMQVRMSRLVMEALARARVAAGRMRWAAVPYPATGSQPSQTEKIRKSNTPRQKSGMETTARDPAIAARSNQEPCSAAEIEPTGMTMANASRVAVPASTAEGSKACRISKATLLPV